MLALALQGLFSLVASALMIMLLQPEWYLIIGAITAAVAGGLMLYNVILVDQDFELGWIATTIFVALIIGLFWPVVPCATAYGAFVERAELLQGRSRER